MELIHLLPWSCAASLLSRAASPARCAPPPACRLLVSRAGKEARFGEREGG